MISVMPCKIIVNPMATEWLESLSGMVSGKRCMKNRQFPITAEEVNGALIKNGLCIAIEPMITLGSPKIGMMPDRWTIKTCDGRCAAHFEHTIAIHHGKADILSSFEGIERIEGKLY